MIWTKGLGVLLLVLIFSVIFMELYKTLGLLETLKSLAFAAVMTAMLVFGIVLATGGES